METRRLFGRNDAGSDAGLLPQESAGPVFPVRAGRGNTPASVPATVAQLNAEALSALPITQVVRKGCPAIYGHYLSTVSMKSGAPMAGTPEISPDEFHDRPDGAALRCSLAHVGVAWRGQNL